MPNEMLQCKLISIFMSMSQEYETDIFSFYFAESLTVIGMMRRPHVGCQARVNVIGSRRYLVNQLLHCS